MITSSIGMQTQTIQSIEWHVYVLYSVTLDRTYVGISVDPQRRLRQHNGELRGGAKSTRMSKDWQIHKLIGPLDSRSTATRVEYHLKKLNKEERLSYEHKIDDTKTFTT